MSAAPPVISCRHVWKLYGDSPAAFLREHNGAPSPEAAKKAGYITAVRDVSLEVHAGEILVVMGLSGSGKSTLVRCLSRLIEPTAGEVFFEGRNLLQASAAELTELRRHRMGMVFQNFALLPHRTVLQNVSFPLEVQGIERKQREEAAAEMLELVGLRGRENYYPRELSGGQQQRVGIARSLAVKPDLWFLDEPFSALDPLIRREMQDEFLRLQSMLHKTIVFITHDFDEAIRLADRIAIMYEGGIDQIGAPESLVLHPRTDYVREFVKDISRDKIITAGSIMDSPDGSSAAAETVGADDTLATAAKKVFASDKPLRVVNANNEVVGVLRRETVLAALFESAP
ncbi:MAG: quaternary amine ABC transporter ATP-binding protein [Gammaproteobacteria bacterium]